MDVQVYQILDDRSPMERILAALKLYGAVPEEIITSRDLAIEQETINGIKVETVTWLTNGYGYVGMVERG